MGHNYNCLKLQESKQKETHLLKIPNGNRGKQSLDYSPCFPSVLCALESWNQESAV